MEESEAIDDQNSGWFQVKKVFLFSLFFFFKLKFFNSVDAIYIEFLFATVFFFVVVDFPI